jgi:hypothetical protein
VLSYPLLRHPEVMKWRRRLTLTSALLGATRALLQVLLWARHAQGIGGRLRAGRDPQLTTSGNRHLGLPAAARLTHESHFETIHPDDREMIYRRLRRARKETGISRWNTACSNRAAASAGCSTAHA